MQAMFVRLSKNSFVRTYDGKGYITNQLTRHDRLYNESGADFLKEISREPQEIKDITDRLYAIYQNSADYQRISNDFNKFCKSLEDDYFIVTGNSEKELASKDLTFNYAMENPKTQVDDFTQEACPDVKETTQDANLEASQRKPSLRSLQFELTSRCNERCIHCYIPNGKKNAGKDMPLEKVFSLIDEFAEMGGLHVTLSGGEVFMHKDIIKIIQYCRKKDMMISILSNLIALKDIQIPFIKAANVSLVQTSLYSMDPEIHDTITTVKGSFEKTKAAIEKLVAADIPVQISCPVMKANCKGYAEVLQYAQSLRCKAQTDYIMMAQADFDTQNLANRISLEETEALLRDILEWDRDYREDTLKQRPISEEIAFDPERFARQPLCGAGINDCSITENGDVYPCAGWQAMVCGNVYKQSLKDIWENSEQFRKVRAVTQGDFPQCLKCEARNFCAMCLVRNYNESNGDMFKINEHFCKVAFLNKKIVEEYLQKQKNMNTNYVEEFAAKYVAALVQTETGNYPENGSEYHELLNSYENLMQAIDSNGDIKNVIDAKKNFEKNVKYIQNNLSKAWERKFPGVELPKQTSIHGINILISKILNNAEAEKL